MLSDFLPGVSSGALSGLIDTIVKQAIHSSGCWRTLIHSYLGLILLLWIGFFLLHLPLAFPASLLLPYVAQVLIGAVAILAFFIAMEKGLVSLVSPLSKLYALIPVVLGVLLFHETLSTMQLVGGVLIILPAVLLSMHDWRNLRLHDGMGWLLLTILGWGYYYTFLRLFISTMGAYPTLVFTETGITVVLVVYALLARIDLALPRYPADQHLLARPPLLLVEGFLYNLSIDKVGVALSSLLLSLGPLVSLLLAHFMLKEKLSLRQYLLIGLMLAGLALLFL